MNKQLFIPPIQYSTQDNQLEYFLLSGQFGEGSESDGGIANTILVHGLGSWSNSTSQLLFGLNPSPTAAEISILYSVVNEFLSTLSADKIILNDFLSTIFTDKIVVNEYLSTYKSSTSSNLEFLSTLLNDKIILNDFLSAILANQINIDEYLITYTTDKTNNLEFISLLNSNLSSLNEFTAILGFNLVPILSFADSSNLNYITILSFEQDISLSPIIILDFESITEEIVTSFINVLNTNAPVYIFNNILYNLKSPAIPDDLTTHTFSFSMTLEHNIDNDLDLIIPLEYEQVFPHMMFLPSKALIIVTDILNTRKNRIRMLQHLP